MGWGRPVVLLLGLCACTMGPDFAAPAPWWSPQSWGTAPSRPKPASVPVAEPVDPQWWVLLGDPLLTRLETQLVAANLDIRIAELHLAEARAQLGITSAAQFPVVNGNASATRIQQSREGALSLASTNPAANSNGLGGRTATPNSTIFQPYGLYQYGFDAAWEIDLWGRVRRSVESANAQVEASEEALHDALITATAELARDYVALRGVQAKLDITRRNRDIARRVVQLTQDRAAGGVTTELDVANARAQLATTEAQLPGLETQEANLINAIARLLGQPPGAMRAELGAIKPIPAVPARVPVGVPSELARRRPDIRQAEAKLHAATADIGVATADFFPRFLLSGSGAIQAVQFGNLADWAAHTYSFGPSVTLPIFEGGRLRATLELRNAQQQDAAIVYQRTLLVALHETDDALTAYAAEQRRRVQLEQAVADNRRALLLASQRYEQGVADFLQVLNAQRGLLGAEQDLADSIALVSTDLVLLYKSLGGGWEQARD